MNRIETGIRSVDNKKDCVFAWIYAEGCQPYLNYKDVADQSVSMPMVLVQLRWSGDLGVTGGVVDGNETLIEALKREVSEEINYIITDDSKIIPMATFKDGDYHLHSFSYKVSFEELIKIRNNAVNAEHSVAECSGYNMVHIADYGKKAGINQFRQNNFCASSKLELNILIKDVLSLDI